MSERSRRPNILFFFTDDQRFGTIHALGNAQIHTPTMDALVERGTAFSHAHIMGGTCDAVCMPSRAMLMTGRTLFHLDGQGQRIPTEHVLLGEHLRRAGYATFGTGKWHNGSDAYARAFSHGDEIFFGGMEDHWNVPACHFDPTGRYETRTPVSVDPWRTNALTYKQCDHITAGKHSSELFADAAIAFLQEHDGASPFFMYLSFMAPHDPRTMPREYLEMYDPAAIDLPPNLLPEHPFDNGELRVRDELLEAWPRTPEAIRRHIAEYYAMITHADAQMARVMAALEEAGEAENTIIIFAGDNGLALGQHGLMGKQNLYDHSLRVPLVVSGPGVPAGQTATPFATCPTSIRRCASWWDCRRPPRWRDAASCRPCAGTTPSARPSTAPTRTSSAWCATAATSSSSTWWGAGARRNSLTPPPIPGKCAAWRRTPPTPAT